VAHDLAAGRGAWLQIALGSATLNGQALATGDAGSATTAATPHHHGRSVEGTEALLFDLA